MAKTLDCDGIRMVLASFPHRRLDQVWTGFDPFSPDFREAIEEGKLAPNFPISVNSGRLCESV